MYSLLIDTLIRDTSVKRHLFNAHTEVPAVRAKADWAMRLVVNLGSLVVRIVDFRAINNHYRLNRVNIHIPMYKIHNVH